jgi:hypothetical protein
MKTYSRADVEAAVQGAFEPSQHAPVLAQLDRYGVQPHEPERERVQVVDLRRNEGLQAHEAGGEEVEDEQERNACDPRQPARPAAWRLGRRWWRPLVSGFSLFHDRAVVTSSPADHDGRATGARDHPAMGSVIANASRWFPPNQHGRRAFGDYVGRPHTNALAGGGGGGHSADEDGRGTRG